MKGLIKADIYMMKGEFITGIKLLGFFTVLSLVLKSPMYIMTMELVITVTYLFAMMASDENGKDAFYQQLSFSRKQIVQEKYIRTFLFLTPFILGSLLITLGICILFRLGAIEFASNTLLAVVYFFASVDVIIPVAIKKGASKARVACFAIITVLCVGVVFAASSSAKFIGGIQKDTIISGSLGILGILFVLLLPVSYKLSVKFYQEKEF